MPLHVEILSSASGLAGALAISSLPGVLALVTPATVSLPDRRGAGAAAGAARR